MSSRIQNGPHAMGGLCGAKTRSGAPCKNKAMQNGRCRMHGGKSTGPKDLSKIRKNKNSEKHGLFSKYLPQDSLDIFNALEDKLGIDMLWDQIKIQYAAIIRSQKLMYVKDQSDTSVISEGKVLSYQHAWDKQANFLNAQARAMTNLTNMIVKYEALCNSESVTEEQRLRIEKLKAEVDYSKAKTESLKKALEGDPDSEQQLAKYFELLGSEIDGLD